jgi:hypothetical protein
MYFKKTLVLSALDGSMKKAVVNVEKFKNRLEGQVRLYNFSQEPEGILSLGILQNNQVLKAGLLPADTRLYTFVLEEGLSLLEGAKSISCALVNFKGGDANPLLFGSSDGKVASSTEIRLASALSLLDDELSVVKTKKVLDEEGLDFDEEEQENIDKLIDEHMKDDGITQPINEKEPDLDKDEKNDKGDKKEKKGLFYNEVKNQISELFTSYPEEEFLTQIIPHSKWVRVDYEKNGHYYVVGLIYEESTLKYICYGLPGMFSEVPPKEMEAYSQWLPLDKDKPQQFGYWISYQDADTGESLEIEVI